MTLTSDLQVPAGEGRVGECAECQFRNSRNRFLIKGDVLDVTKSGYPENRSDSPWRLGLGFENASPLNVVLEVMVGRDL